LIVGGGIAGASVGYALRQRAHVIVLEQEAVCAHHSTGRSTANFAVNFGPPLVRRLTASSRRFMENPPEDFAVESLLRPLGTLIVAAAGQEHLLEREIEAALPGSRMERIDADEIVSRVPVLRRHAAAAGVYDPDNFQLDVVALMRGYTGGVVRHGGAVITNARVLNIRRQHSVWVVQTPAGEFSARHIVNAAGAWADSVARLAGATPQGLRSLRRTVFTFAAEEVHRPRAWPLVRDTAMNLYFKPTVDGELWGSPCDEHASEPVDAQPEAEDVARGVAAIRAATSLAVEPIRSSWAGLRTFAGNGLPVIGKDPRAEGFIWLAGLGGCGNKISPLLGELAAQTVCGGEFPIALAADGVSGEAFAPIDIDPSSG